MGNYASHLLQSCHISNLQCPLLPVTFANAVKGALSVVALTLERGQTMSLLRGGTKVMRGGKWVIRLLLLSFALRALVPMGYMPDFRALSQGVFKVVICTASGSKTLEVALPGKAHPATPGTTHNDQPCAFTGLAVLSLPQLDIMTFAPVLVADAPLMVPLAVTLPPVRAGPILGSRGPPFYS